MTPPCRDFNIFRPSPDLLLKNFKNAQEEKNPFSTLHTLKSNPPPATGGLSREFVSRVQNLRGKSYRDSTLCECVCVCVGHVTRLRHHPGCLRGSNKCVCVSASPSPPHERLAHEASRVCNRACSDGTNLSGHRIRPKAYESRVPLGNVVVPSATEGRECAYSST